MQSAPNGNDRAEGEASGLLASQDSTRTGAKPLLEASHAPEAIRKKTVQVLGERIRLLGIERSGAYEHYNLQLSNGFPIPPGEVAILNLVRRRLPHLRSYHEIGSGLGTLPLMLAYDGFASVGIERDDRRHLTAAAIFRELSVDVPHIEGNCRLIGAAFPDAVADLDVSDSMGILTDFVSSQAPKDYVRLCHGLAQYRYVLMDLQRFCTKRDATEELERLVDELAAYGLAPCDEIIDLESQGYYRLFESKSSNARQAPARELKTVATDGASDLTDASIPPSSMQLPVAPARTELQVRSPTEVAAQDVGVESLPVGGVVFPPMPQRVQRKRFGGLHGISALLVIGIPSLLAVLYYGFWASNQFITSFQFAVRGPSQAGAARAGGSSLGGAGAMSPDSFVVTDYINSPQAIADVERTIDLRAMFAKPDIDFWSRLSSNLSPEVLNAYWTRMVSANFDLISGNITVSVRAFTPEDSFKLARALVASSDEMFRTLNTKAQLGFVRVAEEGVERALQQLSAARQALFVFREEGGLVDPDKTAQAGAAIVDDLRKQLSTVQAQYASIKASAPNSPLLSALSSQISSLEDRIRKEEPLGSSKVRAVTAETLAEYHTLDLERQAAERQYAEALALRTQAHLMAQQQQSYLALFSAPTLPQTSLYPNRLRAILAVVLAAAAVWFVGMLIVYGLRDHLM